jgi:hypothetical protein
MPTVKYDFPHPISTSDGVGSVMEHGNVSVVKPRKCCRRRSHNLRLGLIRGRLAMSLGLRGPSSIENFDVGHWWAVLGLRIFGEGWEPWNEIRWSSDLTDLLSVNFTHASVIAAILTCEVIYWVARAVGGDDSVILSPDSGESYIHRCALCVLYPNSESFVMPEVWINAMCHPDHGSQRALVSVCHRSPRCINVSKDSTKRSQLSSRPHHRPRLARSMCEKVVNIRWSAPQAHKQSKSPGAREWKYNWPSHFSLVCTLPLSRAQIFSFSRYTIIE